VLVCFQELLPLSDVGNRGVRCFEVTVPRLVVQEMADSRDSFPFRIFLRLFHYTPGSKVLCDGLPDNCVVVINDKEVQNGMPVSLQCSLPPGHYCPLPVQTLQHNPYPNMPKRYFPRPVDLNYHLLYRSLLLRPQVPFNAPPPTTTSLRVMLNWDARLGKRWAVGVWAVRRVSVDTLFERVVTGGGRVIPKELTMRMAHRAVTGDGEVKVLDAPSMSLLCPVSGC
jgi:hypothetical protein